MRAGGLCGRLGGQAPNGIGNEALRQGCSSRRRHRRFVAAGSEVLLGARSCAILMCAGGLCKRRGAPTPRRIGSGALFKGCGNRRHHRRRCGATGGQAWWGATTPRSRNGGRVDTVHCAGGLYKRLGAPTLCGIGNGALRKRFSNRRLDSKVRRRAAAGGSCGGDPDLRKGERLRQVGPWPPGGRGAGRLRRSRRSMWSYGCDLAHQRGNARCPRERLRAIGRGWRSEAPRRGLKRHGFPRFRRRRRGGRLLASRLLLTAGVDCE
mmetsp:Transcript_18925/g.54800  ORF Transcript_18925/g.54800 Transcript_18925/m.54800 type:complete len:265 (-) Transcript_18925:3043-3837(-)